MKRCVKTQDRCAVTSCGGTKSDPEPLFRFPRDANRSKQWMEKCQRKDLADKSADQLHRYYRLCGKHFESSLIEINDQGTVLKDDAIPTVFEKPNQSQNGQGKRGKETTKPDETDSRERKKMKTSQADTAKEDSPAVSEEEGRREYLRALFEVLLLLGEQHIPPTGPGDVKDNLWSNNFEMLLEYRMNCEDEAVKRQHDDSKESQSSSAQLSRLMEVCERCIRSKLVEEVKHNGPFSLLTDDVVKISGELYLPVFVRFVDESNSQQERFFGFLDFDGEGEALAEKLLSELTNKWGLDMEQCRGQAHSYCGTHFRRIKAFSAKLTEKYPKVVLALRSSQTLNVALASGMALTGVQLVMSTLKKIESLFSQSQLLQQEFENSISVFYSDREEKANELKEACRCNWTRQHDVFEVMADVLEALLFCVDSVHDTEDTRWNDEVTYTALDISKALTDFEFVIALVVLKNTMTLTRAFGKNVQGKEADAHFAASSLKAVVHSLKEVVDNIDVYHEFWNDEAVNLANAMDVPVKLPRSFLRKNPSESGTAQPDSYYKNHLSVPVVNHIITEISELFREDHLKTLRCLSLVPAITELHKSSEPDEESVQAFKNMIPNAATLSAELHCWWVKWSKTAKGETVPANVHETLQLADVKFFPNMLAVLRLIGVLPTLALEESCDVAHKRFRAYMENMPDQFKSKSLAVLNMNYDVGCELDSLVEVYMNTYSARGNVV